MPLILGDQVRPRDVPSSALLYVSPQHVLRLLHRWLLPSAYVAAVTVFLTGISLSWRPGVGFTSLIHFGSKFESGSLDVLKSIPHVVMPASAGYDGQFYAQLALSPTLQDPQLPEALDSPSYRSRRILFSWTASLLGLGRPAWVIQAYAVQNVLFWLATAVLLLRWLPPTRWFHFFQWAAILFSRGWLESVGSALLDGPALFLMLLAVWWTERGRQLSGAALLGVSLLGKETNLLGGLVALPELLSKGRWTKGTIVRSLLLVLPVVLWMGIVYLQFGVGRPAGRRNFAAPFAGWFGKIEELKLYINQHGWRRGEVLAALCMISTLVQIAYFATIRQWSSRWWRMGAPYGILGVCLGVAVLEGYPGAFTRALLPMLAAYNLSLKPTRLGWLLLALGNLGLIMPEMNGISLERLRVFWH